MSSLLEKLRTIISNNAHTIEGYRRSTMDQPEPRGGQASFRTPSRWVVCELITPFARQGFPASITELWHSSSERFV